MKTKMIEVIRKMIKLQKSVLETSTMSVISVYALQTGLTEDEKYKFWLDIDLGYARITRKEKNHNSKIFKWSCRERKTRKK